ncbi:MAG: thrombospondin type 3 repeat-containing protein [Polyangiaceae bacterium]
MRRSRLLSFSAVSLLALARTASAQTLPSVDTRTWTPSVDPHAGIIAEPVVTPGAWNWNVGAWLNYADHPVTLRDPASGNVALRPVSYSFGTDLTANVGIGSRAAIGLDVPFILYQDGSNTLPASVSQTKQATNTAIGDMAIQGKAAIIPNANGGFGLAALGLVTLPTGDRTSFAGDGSARVGARLLAEYTVLFAAVQGSLGYTLRTDDHTWPAASAGGYQFGSEIPWSFVLQAKPAIAGLDQSQRQIWELGLHGWLPGGPVGPFGTGDPGSAALSPVMLAASDRVSLGHYRDTYFLAGGDIGLDSAVGVPAFRLIAGFGWAPRDHDIDHDGVPDDIDQCPEIPEDRDGFEDDDGCPEIDNDDDGIVDKEDFCPNVKGVAQPGKLNGCPIGDADLDGIPDNVDACPREKGVKSNDSRLNGCPVHDRDGDGIVDAYDKCPDQAEDKDGFQDQDGCPDPDNDGDGISDAVDACPNVAGEPSTDPKMNGCPNPDTDGDTYENEIDKCPDQAEVFNGVQDDDGCPDTGGKALVTIAGKDNTIRLARPIKLSATANPLVVDEASWPELRALTLELNRHRDWTLAVGAKPDPKAGDQASLARAVAVVRAVTRFAHRDGVAETVGWDAVKQQPTAASGIGLAILVAPKNPSPVVAPTPKK